MFGAFWFGQPYPGQGTGDGEVPVPDPDLILFTTEAYAQPSFSTEAYEGDTE